MFITLEGVDGSGKTHPGARCSPRRWAHETLLLREPGGTEVGERVRELLKDPELELDPRAELLLFCAARAELCAAVIPPALARPAATSSATASSTPRVAYQGAARGLGVEMVEGLNAIAIGGCVPGPHRPAAPRPGAPARGRRG